VVRGKWELSAVPAGVLEEVLADPAAFLAAATRARREWSAHYGGAEGVAQLTTALLDHLAAQASATSALREAAVEHLHVVRRHPWPAIADLLGIHRSRAWRLRRARTGEGSWTERFPRLADPRAWSPEKWNELAP